MFSYQVVKGMVQNFVYFAQKNKQTRTSRLFLVQNNGPLVLPIRKLGPEVTVKQMEFQGKIYYYKSITQTGVFPLSLPIPPEEQQDKNYSYGSNFQKLTSHPIDLLLKPRNFEMFKAILKDLSQPPLPPLKLSLLVHMHSHTLHAEQVNKPIPRKTH